MYRRPLSDLVFSVFDVETTGLLPRSDRVVELAVVRVTGAGKVLGRYETLVNPVRDVGATAIHGLTASMVAAAPTFAEIAGDALTQLADSIWVGHNVRFDLRFLEAELGRLGVELRPAPALCTMKMARSLGPSLECHRLGPVCEALGVPLMGAHSAAGDAEATAGALVQMLAEAPDFEITCLEELAPYALVAEGRPLSRAEIPLAPSGRCLVREAAPRCAGASSFFANVASRLHATCEHQVEDDHLGLYLHLLDRALEDRVLEPHEIDELVDLANEWSFSLEDVRRAHRTYFGMLVGTALDDGVITEAEQQDLEMVAAALDLDPDDAEQIIARSRERSDAAVRPAPVTASLEGVTVCFTGQTIGPNGAPITRAEATRLAERAGLVPAKTVTKKLDLLVVVDPATQSSKARKARQYGTRIMACAPFWKQVAGG